MKLKSITLLLVTLLLLTACADKPVSDKPAPAVEMSAEEKEEMKESILKSLSEMAKQNADNPKLPIKGLKTDTSKSLIDLEAILSGGPGKDGIPAINDPKFTSIDEAGFDDDTLGVLVSFDGVQRYYPYNILVWHEIVNDSIGDNKYAVSFCPLCGSAILYNREIGDETVRFGVSGLLYESNLLMYDNLTESLWSQAAGEAVVGSYTGTELEVLPMQLITFEEVKEKYPDAEVLSKDTGYKRNYSVYPYGDYEETERLYFPISVNYDKYFAKEIMYVVNVDEKSLSFPYKNIPEGETIIDDSGVIINRNGGEIEVTHNKQKIPGYFEMWFSWAVHHQEDGAVWDEF